MEQNPRHVSFFYPPPGLGAVVRARPVAAALLAALLLPGAAAVDGPTGPDGRGATWTQMHGDALRQGVVYGPSEGDRPVDILQVWHALAPAGSEIHHVSGPRWSAV